MLPFQFFSPFKGGIQKWLTQNSYGGEIDKFVQEMIAQSLSNSNQNNHVSDAIGMFDQEERKQETPNSPLNISFFETHDHVYVKVPIKDVDQLSNLKMFHTTNQIIIEGFPALEDRHVFPLPFIVKMKGASSEYRDDFLQVKMIKKIDLQYSEIDVRGLD
jgi:hypothetical protein